jgi:hypothetical protein
MRLSLDEINRRGMEALREKLGPVGMIRFLQQFETGHGDYATERRAWVDRTSLAELRKLAGGSPRDPKRRRR